MRNLLLHWVFNAIALWVAAYFIPGLDFTGDLLHLILVAAVFGLVNSLLRPLLTVLTCPLIVLTLGLFLVVVNVLMLELTDWLVPDFELRSFGSALAAALIVSAVNLVLGRVTRRL